MTTTATTTTPADWRAIYERRLTSAEAAAARIKSGDQVYLPTGQQIHAVIRALVARAGELRDVTVTCIQAADYGWFGPEFAGRIRANILYANPFTREAVAQGKADYTPFMIYGHHKALDEGRPEGRRIDVNVISVTPPNSHGYVSLGHAVWDAKTSVKRAAQTIAVVNKHIPRTFGDTWLHVSEIDAFVEDHTPIPDITARTYPPPEPWDEAIAGYVSSLVNDGDTIQIGTGSTTGNLNRLGAFDTKHDLGMFAELTVPGTIDLVRRGIITGRKMTTHPGKFVATTAGNSNEDRAFLNDNPAFALYPVEYVLNPRMIAANDNYKAINNAIAVDLTGQIAASTIGPQIYSGTGGHFCFAMGAFMSRGGRYICVLPSTARNGSVSRIVPHFEPGQVVTVPRDIADTVVTEYGIACLLNRSLRERAEALIAIAHPDFRAELRKAARRLYWGEK
jgi:4-hydroxybutyrate CoA-transferase